MQYKYKVRKTINEKYISSYFINFDDCQNYDYLYFFTISDVRVNNVYRFNKYVFIYDTYTFI